MAISETNEDGSQDDDFDEDNQNAEDGEIEIDEDDEEDEEEDQPKFIKKRLMNITFPDEEIMQKFGPELIEFMQQKCDNLGVELDNERVEITFFEKVADVEEDRPIFTIDSTPAKGRSASSDVPRYNQSLADALTHEKTPAKEEGGSRRSQSCFNCDGDHNLRDCDQPRNHQKINANRKARTGKTERYHVDLSQRYGHLRPGQISKKLAKALGLKSKDLPLHVFRMRKLGYPPGWLEDAKISHSGINLFGSDGTVVLESDDEDGEVEQVKDKYDPTKIIEYPGFNVDAPEDAYDDAKLFDCPPMQDEHRKDTFLANLGVNLATAYKRRKMNSFPMNDSITKTDDVDMDVAGGIVVNFYSIKACDLSLFFFSSDEDGELKETPSLPVTTATTEMQPPPLPAAASSERTDVESAETEVAANGSSKGVNDSLIDFILTRDANESISGTENKESVEVNNRLLASKEVVEGTPLLKSASVYEKLPDGDKWAVGVTDVINFENLPDSVGKYEKMKVLIKKVQTAFQQSNNE